jgi:Zn-dependent peptidase ImmA (M78 family)
MDRTKIAREAARRAIQLREQLGLTPDQPVDAISVAERLGIRVTLRPETTVEGLYARTSPPSIITSAHRPIGRIAFSVGHELGHHVYGHPGVSMHEYMEKEVSFAEKSIPELEADYFAGHFLMPNRGVRAALLARGWSPASLSPDQAFRLSCLFGVSYAALLAHMRFNLQMIDDSIFSRLSQLQPKDVKEALLGFKHTRDLLVVDSHWGSREIDLRTNDYAMIAGACTVVGACVTVDCHAGSWTILKAIRQGVGTVRRPEGATTVRVSGKSTGEYFTGHARNRFEEDPDDGA